MRKFAVILSGCGVYDGSEIHEAVFTLLAIKKMSCDYQVFAPDIYQSDIINHYTGESMDEERNVLVESARIARGEILPLSKFNVNDYDALVFPGGYGVVKNLCDYANRGINCEVLEEIKEIVKGMHEKGKPIGGICISSVMLVSILKNIRVTIGNDENTSEDIENMGGRAFENRRRRCSS
jgi:enhancing lycopene biosynthesis protein 2